jgi:hypothetical protein
MSATPAPLSRRLVGRKTPDPAAPPPPPPPKAPTGPTSPGPVSLRHDPGDPPAWTIPGPAALVLPMAAMTDDRLHHADLNVLGAVAAWAQGRARCWPDDDEISRLAIRISPKAVAKSLDRLAEAGYLRLEADPARSTGRTIILAWR